MGPNWKPGLQDDEYFPTWHEGIVWCTNWHPSGELLVSCGQDKVIRLWRNVSDGDKKVWKLTDELKGAHTKTIRSAAFSPCGRKLAAAGFDGTVSIWTLSHDNNVEWKCIASLEGHENEVKGVTWSPDGKLLATCGRDKTVWIWEINPGDDDPLGCQDPDFECLAVLAEHSQDVKMVRFSPTDSRTIFSTSYDDTVKIWRSGFSDDDEWFCHQTLTDHASTVWAIAVSSCGRIIATVGDDKMIAIFRRAEGGKVWEIASKSELAHDRCIFSVDISGDEKNLLATCGGDRCIKFWIINYNSALSLTQVNKYEIPGRKEANCIRWNPEDPSLLAVAGDDGHLEILRVNHN